MKIASLSLKLVLIVSAVLFAGSTYSKKSASGRTEISQPIRGKSQGAQKSPAANDRGTKESPLFIKEVQPVESQEETARAAKDRDEKKANDQKLIDFTRGLVIGTFILAGVGFLQIIVFGLQSFYLRKEVNAANKQSEAMERSITEANRLASAMEVISKDIAISAKAATESVVAVKERTAQQMRAYLTVVVGGGIYQDRAKNLKFQAGPLIVNTGHTPAHKVAFRVRAEVLPVPLPENFAFHLPAEAVGTSVIGPQQNFTVSPIVERFCDDADVEKIKRANGVGLYAWGIVTYEDVFGETQYTKFCQIVTWLADDKIWAYYPARHNEST